MQAHMLSQKYFTASKASPQNRSPKMIAWPVLAPWLLTPAPASPRQVLSIPERMPRAASATRENCRRVQRLSNAAVSIHVLSSVKSDPFVETPFLKPSCNSVDGLVFPYYVSLFW